MFFIMAIFERFLKPRSTPLSNSSEAVDGGNININHRDLDHQSQMDFNDKLPPKTILCPIKPLYPPNVGSLYSFSSS
ncbi:hypothetical protein MKX01_017587 [Papaver californicum]|nr:hypothetical protein MKX01_017587 [Papaver californicum]